MIRTSATSTSPSPQARGSRLSPQTSRPRRRTFWNFWGYNLYVKNYCPENRVPEFAKETLKNLPHVKTDDEALYIHIRSGDAFIRHDCRYHGQPPACFYESIIEKWGFRKVYILCEDTNNPVILYLVRKYNATLLIIDLKETVSIILDAKNLAISFGTFASSILRLATEDPKKRIFRYGDHFYYARVFWKKFYYTDASDRYFKNLLNINWFNSDAQREMMFTEECGAKWKISTHTEYSRIE